ncbi:preprotein translocase subunit SecA [Schleiferia thermophila]|jgi:preprotein translocase subunit SecA|uniref:preprotein translocase subunit SecA n=1 Tax=Schleiferia thermophila TaxID=884107 RepID=UPI002FD89132
MINKLLTKLFGSKNQKDLEEIHPFVKRINEIYPTLQSLSDDELRDKTTGFKEKIAKATANITSQIEQKKLQADQSDDVDLKEKLYSEIEKLEKQELEIIEKVLLDLLPEAFAVVRETARRFKENEYIEVTATEFDRALSARKSNVQILGDKARWSSTWLVAGHPVRWDMVHYDVQLIGGVALHKGKIAEMATGEGKTLVATLPVYLNALAGKGVHLVTVNDYLAKRDADWMGPIYEFHGLSVGCIDKTQPNSPERRAAYQCDITFGTNSEFGFDYLRDNMARSIDEIVQRKHHFAIVDEVDSVLIDDARTPLIISGPTGKNNLQDFEELKPYVARLVEEQRKIVTTELNEAKKLIAAGNTKDGGFHLLRAHRGLPKFKPLIKYLSEEGIKTILQKTENYYLQEQGKEMPKVDAALLFTIEEKNNQIDLTEKGIEFLSRDTSPDFFILPDIGAAVAEIEKQNTTPEEKIKQKEQLMRDFALRSERIHIMNQLVRAYTMFERDVEYVVMDNKVKIVDEQTGRIMEGRRYSDGLHQAIEAKEGVKIEAATQTYATITLQNYFRMYHKLAGMTGTAETEAAEFWDIYKLDVVVIPTNKPVIRQDKEDLVYKTKREKFNAVIEEIINLVQQNRPVLVGTTSVENSELLSRALTLRKIKHNVLNAKLHQREAEIVAEAGRPGTVTIATNMAGRGTDIKLTPESRAAGGLAIIGTERHDSRRVDRQLRGRAGRQGDPGSSQFFVSLEDNLMRLFGSERIASIMDRLGHKEGEVIQHSMVTKSIERAQRKVEENNFGIRKRLLEYDDVMNKQREVIYRWRRNALYGEKLAIDLADAIYQTCASSVELSKDTKDFEGFRIELARYFGIDSPFSREEFERTDTAKLIDQLYHTITDHYTKKSQILAEKAWPAIKNVFETHGTHYQNILIPFTDGHKGIQIAANLQKAYETRCQSIIRDFEKSVTLTLIDEAWKDHLRDMDDLRQAVQGAIYEQKDPLLIYKFESFELFKKMKEKLNRELVSFLMHAFIPVQNAEQVTAPAPARHIKNRSEVLTTSGPASSSLPDSPPTRRPIISDKKYGRNDHITIQNLTTGERKNLKYKQAQPLLQTGNWVIID